jgi:hypothetical protein
MESSIMPNLQIDGIGTIEVDDGFKNLSPDQQNAFVENVVGQIKQGGQQPQVPQTPTQQPAEGFQERNARVARQFAMGVPQGLGNAAVGAFQAATDVGEKAAQLLRKFYPETFGEDMGASTFGNRLAEQVRLRKEQQAQLPTSEKVGIAIGEVAPYLATGIGTGAKVAAATGSRIAGLAAGGAVGGAVSSALSAQEQAGLGK